jgi:N-acetylneuraminate synthase|tara:strand:+ start:3403 stop:4479 length:1077 start_codon:yes stop_codon:yes gene_type:complete
MSSKRKDKIYVIAEIGVNHNGKISLAKKLIQSAKKAGADAVKFQNFSADNLATQSARKAPYQIKNTKNNESQYLMLKNLELKRQDYFKLKNFSKKFKIDFISSVFDQESIFFLIKKLKIKKIKIPSGELTNFLILKELNLKNCQILLSTGMSNIKEIISAINIISKSIIYKFKKNKVKVVNYKMLKKIKKKLTVLHCVTDYPVDDKYANLKCIGNLSKQLKINIGYSDHTKGIIAPLIAASKGARVIEKHFTLNKKMKGPDHKASLEPREFKEMVKNLRDYELMCGDGEKKIQKCELKNINIARKSIVAKLLIKKNEKFTYRNLTAKRPGDGLNPMIIENLINKKSKKTFYPDEQIKI